jgi:hypothetical protein
MNTIPENKVVEMAGARVAPAKIQLAAFMLEDYLDAIEAKMALRDPENVERIQWEQLKSELGL